MKRENGKRRNTKAIEQLDGHFNHNCEGWCPVAQEQNHYGLYGYSVGTKSNLECIRYAARRSEMLKLNGSGGNAVEPCLYFHDGDSPYEGGAHL